MKSALAGTRIRERRRHLNLKQSALAEAAGISASYLNLIEHNRRTVSGRVLVALARELDMPSRELAEGAEAGLVGELRQVLADHPDFAADTSTVEEFIGRFPEWARILAAQARQIRDNEAAIATFTDRQNFDPHLQNTLHEMLTTITAIRSTSGILTSTDDIEAPQRNRFQNVIHAESRRLSDAAQNLVSYFDHAQETTEVGASAHELFETFLAKRNHVFKELENAPAPQTIANILKAELKSAPTEAQRRARDRMETYAADASTLPLEAFQKSAQTFSYAPDQLARTFSTDIHTIFRRLATLKRNGMDAPSFGLVIVNAAGQPQFRRPLEDFSLPRFSSICALWPAFQALSTPSQPISDVIVLPNGREFLARAIALPSNSAEFGQIPAFSSAMLVTSLNDAHRYGMITGAGPLPSRQVGTSCRLCQQKNCAARSEPSILPA